MEEREKFISMFRINGEPILPPLMTMEKRFEMQMYREKAAQLESKLQKKRVQFNEVSLLASPRSPSATNSDNVSQLSSDMVRQSESEMDDCSVELTRKVLVNTACNTEPKPSREFGTNTPKIVGELSLTERASLLEKSGPIGFDLVANAVITSLSASEKAAAQKQVENKRTNIEALRELVEKVNLERTQSKKSMHLPLAIPAICVNPPTPLTDVHKLGDVFSGTESVDSFDASGFQSSQCTRHQVAEITADSTDESCGTQSTEHIALLTPQKKITNITARILQFEQAEFNAAAEYDQYFGSRPPKRSATSPSLKSLGEKPMNALTSSPRSEDAAAPTLVRSSSFTLDAPSKALIDHLQKEYEQSVHKSHSTTNSSKSPICVGSENRSKSAPSVTRDTVESKAKRVQKKLDFKPSSRQSSSSRSKVKNNTFNTYPNSTAHLWSSPLPPVKVKKSPYDAKVSATSRSKSTHTKASSGHKHQATTAKTHKSHATKKSNSSAAYTIQQSTSQQILPPKIDIANEIESSYRQKLNALIAQQRDEERRMQQMFNAQRQMLMDQLDNEKFQGNIDGDNDLSTLQIEGISIDCAPYTATAAKFNGNFYNAHTASTSATLDSISPTLSITSSYIPSSLSHPTVGFSTTTTLAHCDVAQSTASSPITKARSPQRAVKSAPYRIATDKHTHGIGLTTQIASNYNNNCDSIKRPSKSLLQEYDHELEKKHAAATIINAGARGFLVRRLFQTEQIQRIVQTIKDTLIFVLNLHMETMENEEEANTEANIKLKARLLQQLASASRTLHLIFFQTSVKERMEIIMRDRKRIKAKLLSMSWKRSPRIA